MATLFDSASLVMIPSGVKESKLYSVKPSNGDGDFTFSRGTDTATRVNASGLIEKERGNLLLQSNTFDTTWANSTSTETSGQSGYDGSSDAWLLDKTAADGYIVQSISLSGVQSFSVYAKSGTLSWIRLFVIAGTNADAFFNLSDGSLGTNSGVISATSEDVGGGWYRYVVVLNSTISSVRIYPADADNDTSGTSGNIYIQDAMLNQGLVAQPYIETTTAAVYEGITDNLPRLDYSGGASCPSLLLEPSRTNGLPQSEYFNAWTALNDVAITANSITSPEGLLNGSLMAASGVGATARNVRQGSQSTSTDVKTLSVYAKANASNYIQLFHSGDAQGYVNFDLANGEVGTSGTNATADIEPMGNDWYRCIATFDSGANFGSSVYIGFATSASASYGGGSVADTSSVYIFGAQYETGSYPTSYIPTYGTSASRAQDSASKTGLSSSIGQTEGTAYVEFEIDVNDSFDDDFPSIIHLSDGTSDNRLSLFINDVAYTPAKAHLFVRTTAGIQAQIIAPSSIATGNHKIAFAYANNDFVLYMDGVQLGTDTSGSVPACSVVSFSGPTGSSNPSENKTKQALVFPTRLTNAELAALTA